MAYTAVFSLAHSLDHLSYSDHFYDSHHSYRCDLIESLQETVCSLKSTLEKIYSVPETMMQSVNDLETEIRDVVYKAQHTVDSFIRRQTLSSGMSKDDMSEDDRSFALAYTHDLRDINESVKSITGKAKMVRKSVKSHHRRSDSASVDSSDEPDCVFGTKSGEIVGHERYLELLKGMLLKEDPSLQWVRIIGMAAIGKTTLAKSAYEDPSIQSHFETRVWVTVRTEYRDKCRIVKLFVHMDSSNVVVKVITFKIEYDHGWYNDLELGELVEIFTGTKCLLVIDDMRDQNVWGSIEDAFLEDENGSRIVMTTRNADFGLFDRFTSYELKDPFLNEDESWSLLCSVVFTSHGESCPPQLEKIGRNIAKNCEGLPPLIVEVGKLLREIGKTVEEWRTVEERDHLVTITADDATPLSRKLSLSYKELQPDLKACFLYMGLLPKKTEVRRSVLTNLWVAERFIEDEPAEFPNLERVAEHCLKKLVSESLILVCKESSDGRTKTCRVHVVYRSLCMSIAWKETFFHVISKLSPNTFPQGTNNHQRLSFHNNIVLGFKQVHGLLNSVPAARSLFCLGPHHQYPIQVYFPLKVLRVLDSLALRFYKFPNEVLELVLLRYLAITYDGELPPSISKLRHLEVLILRRHHIIKYADGHVNYLPIEIWHLSRLRHLHCMGSDLPDPSSAPIRYDGYDSQSKPNYLEYLLTLSGVSAHSCTEIILQRLPYLEKVSIRIELAPDDEIETFRFFSNLRNWRLDSLKCVVVDRGIVWSRVPTPVNIFFPQNIEKLSLSGCGLSWECFGSSIGLLQRLKVLKVRCNAFQGAVWRNWEAWKLESLEFLLLEDLDLEEWEVGKKCFPSMERLVIRHCYKLREINVAYRETRFLERIEVDDSSPAIEAWARAIHDKRLGSGNYGDAFQVTVHSSRDDEKRKS